jgi:ferredoxin-NADP reductase
MADILERIPNPVARSLTAALMGASAATILTGGLLGLSKLEDQRVNQLAVYTGIAGAIAGAVFGGMIKPQVRAVEQTAKSPSDGWTDWRNFVVSRKVPESQEITSFYLKPQDGQPIPNFQPGQFLTIKLDIPDQPRPVMRTYSLSDFSVTPDYYRLSIKREDPPKGKEVPPGVASNFMHDHIQEGSVIPCKPPNGKFVLDGQSQRPVVLISNGVGITPMISMAKAVAMQNSNRPLWFLHGARDGSYHAFREAVLEIAPNNPNFTVHYRYSRPRPDDDGGYHSTGYVDIELVKSLLMPRVGPTDADYFLCGSPSFMDSLREGLGGWGVPNSQVYFESFSKPVAKAAAPVSTSSGNGPTTEVVFAKSGKTATWTEADGTLLEFAEDRGLSPDYSCRAGICLTCMCRLEEGEVAYDESPTGTPDEGHALICVSKPKTSRVVLNL